MLEEALARVGEKVTYPVSRPLLDPFTHGPLMLVTGLHVVRMCVCRCCSGG